MEPTINQTFQSNHVSADPTIMGTAKYLGNGQYQISDTYHGDWEYSTDTPNMQRMGFSVPNYAGAPAAMQKFAVDNSNTPNGRLEVAPAVQPQVQQITTRSASGQALYNGQPMTSGPGNTPGPTTPTTTAPTPAPAPAPATTTPAPTVQAQTFSSSPAYGNYSPGQTGAEVSALQGFLRDQGYMTQAQINTGPGIYGPKTTAALASYKAANPQVVSNQEGSSPQSQGIQQQAPQNTPQQSGLQQVMQDYKTAYDSMGLGNIQDQYKNFVQQQTDLETKKAGEVEQINNNPWMTQSVKDLNVSQINKNYLTQENIITNKVSLLDALYKEGQQEVNNIVSKAEAIDQEQQRQAYDTAKQKQDAIYALAQEKAKQAGDHSPAYKEWQDYVSTGGKLGFNDYQTMDEKRKASGSGKLTQAEITRQQDNDVSDAFLLLQKYQKNNNQAGIDPAAYSSYVTQLKSQYGAGAVVDLNDMLNKKGLQIDTGKDTSTIVGQNYKPALNAF